MLSCQRQRSGKMPDSQLYECIIFCRLFLWKMGDTSLEKREELVYTYDKIKITKDLL